MQARLEPLSADVIVAIAGSLDAQDLAERLSGAVTGQESMVPVRIWSVEVGGRPLVLSQCATRGRAPSGGLATVLAAMSHDGPLPSGSVTLGALLADGAPFGVLEVGHSARLSPTCFPVLLAAVAARLTAMRETGTEGSLDAVTTPPRSASDTQAVIAAFANEARRLIDHDRLSVYMLTPDGLSLERFAVATSPVLSGESDVIGIADIGLAYVLDQNRPLVSDDLAADPRLVGPEDSIIAAAGFHGLVSVPLRIASTPVGLLNFVSREIGYYTDEDAAIAQRIADQIVIFLQNLRLEQRVRLSIGREAARQERSRIAHELHDTIAQSLAAMVPEFDTLSQRLAGIDADALHEVSDMRARIRLMLHDLRRSLLRARPAELENASLSDAIARVLDTVEVDQGIRGNFEVVGAVDSLPAEVEMTVFRIFQEAVANARKHADPSELSVRLRVGESLVLSIDDDGAGFVPSGRTEGFGLRGMRERAEEIGGRLIVSSTASRGTSVNLTVPSLGNASPGNAQSVRRRPRDGDGKSNGHRALRVVVVDDHPVFREAVSRMLELEKDIRVVALAESGAEAQRSVDHLHPDLVLLDLELPDGSGIEVARRLNCADRPPRVLMLSAFADPGKVVAAMQAGAHGFLAKTVSREHLVDSVRAVARGATVFDSAAGAALWSAPQEQPTRRELDVLSRIAAGKTNAEIADELYLAKKTVERVVATVTIKLAAANRTHAVAKAIALRLIEARPD
jgi:signal transduction histidine kinase/DNA-binding NarL/FixJ family response regulator